MAVILVYESVKCMRNNCVLMCDVYSTGRIESDEEYDSEMDDFIDDGEEDVDYSKYIKEIFGYDKSR